MVWRLHVHRPIPSRRRREAYTWLRHNTAPDAKVASWWDYGEGAGGGAWAGGATWRAAAGAGGRWLSPRCLAHAKGVNAGPSSGPQNRGPLGYQTTAMANRTIVVDNNTWNTSHIATVGRAMASPEAKAWRIYRQAAGARRLGPWAPLWGAVRPPQLCDGRIPAAWGPGSSRPPPFDDFRPRPAAV
jgi:hypothetical protein